MTDRIKKEEFQSAVNSEFRVEGEGVALSLLQIREGRSTERIEQFSLMFRGPLEPMLKQGTRHVSHPALGEMDLFLVPVGATPEGVEYEAAFTRFLEKK